MVLKVTKEWSEENKTGPERDLNKPDSVRAGDRHSEDQIPQVPKTKYGE